MSLRNILTVSLLVVPAVIAFIELFRLLPLTNRVLKLIAVSRKALAVIRAPDISDHWKEKAIPRYARDTMVLSLLITFYLTIMFLVFGVVFGLLGLLFFGNLHEVIELSYQVETLIITVIFGVLYAFLRNKMKASEGRMNSDYTPASRMLHYIALNNSFIKEMAFDIDCMMTRSRPLHVSSPVFVAGLARAGTTILLEALYSTGVFTTLTYRDMPFVTAPYLWSKITKGHRLKGSFKKERAHGDRLCVNYDSPEAFEEVFWLTFSNAEYVKDSYLALQDVDVDLLEKYKRFVGNIISRQDDIPSLRYLAKNNNNLMRIEALKSAFPDSFIIVPFRNPLDHAKSLLIQHKRFLETHAEDPFSLKYMNWLGHFEFGANFKPLKVSPEVIPQNKEEPMNLDYWLQYWKSVYEYVIEHHSADVIFFDYDKLCETPEISLGRLGSELSLDEALLKPFSANIKAARKHMATPEEQALSGNIKKIHDVLLESS